MIKLLTTADFLPAELGSKVHGDVAKEVARAVMEGARAYWIQLAAQRLTSSRRDYQDAIQPVVDGDGYAAVTLVGPLATMVEEGMPGYDMHDTLLGPNVPVAGPGQKGKRPRKEGGFYRAIPFRHQVPSSSGQGGGQVMGSQYFQDLPRVLAKSLQAELGKAVHAQARRLEATRGMPRGSYGPVHGGTSSGGRLPAGVGGIGKLRAHHTTDIFAGMIKSQKTYARATQNTYMTFRTISDGVKGKWLHPGIHPANLVEEVVRHIEKTAPQAFLAATWG